jgi:hypothetical protein
MRRPYPVQGQSALEYVFLYGGAMIVLVLMLALLVTIVPQNFNWVSQQTEKTYDEQICDQIGDHSFSRCIVSDLIPPGDVSGFNISFSPSIPRTIYLSWIWPADDGLTQGGPVTSIEIAFVHDSLTNGQGVDAIRDANQFSQFLVAGDNLHGTIASNNTFSVTLPAPHSPGTPEVLQLQFPPGMSGTYYFGIRARDDANRVSLNITANTYTV